MKTKFILIYCLLLALCGLAQQNKIDSLLTLLKTDKADTNKLVHLNKISREYRNTGTYDSAMLYANSALLLSTDILKKITDLKIKLSAQKNEGNAYNIIGSIYNYQSNYPAALKNQLAALKIREIIGDKTGIAGSYNGIGNVYYNQGNYPEALKNYLASLKIGEEIGDNEGVAGSYNGIGNVYSDQGNYPEALKNYSASLKIREATGDQKGIADSYNNIGLIYSAQGNYPNALKSYSASLKIRETIGDKKGVSASYTNMGGVYESQGNSTDALINFFASLKIKEALGEKAGIANAYNNIGTIFTKQKKYKEAEVYLIRSKELAKGIGDKETLKEVYSTLTTLDSAKNNYKGAYENHKLYILYRDSLDNEDTRQKTIQSQMTYDFEKKETKMIAEHDKQTAMAEAENRRQKTIILAVIGGLLLVIVFSVFISNRLQITRRQKQIIEEQKQIVDQKNIHITESITYAKRIQDAILPSREELLNYFPHHFIFFRPKEIISGDFYWYYPVTIPSPTKEEENNQELSFSQYAGGVLFAAVDCTGHGVPGAFMSMIGNTLLNKIVNEQKIIQPAEILNHLQKGITSALHQESRTQDDGMDISICLFNKEKNKIVFAGAHHSVFIVHEGTMQTIKGDPYSIGTLFSKKNVVFTQKEILLQKNSSVFFSTDGFEDQPGGIDGKKFLSARLENLFLSVSSLEIKKQEETITKTFDDWKGEHPQRDDILLAGIRI